MASDTKQAKNGSVFISYSRQDKNFVRKLVAALEANEVKVWVDWESIPPSADWMAEITGAVQGSDAFICVITPAWLGSKVCAQEYNLGLQNNKKLIPIMHRQAEKRRKMPERLSSTNWIYMRPKQDQFKVGLAKVVEAIATDLDWVKEQTRLLQRAAEWENKKRNPGFLLQGADLEDGERWMSEAAARPGQQILPLQADYIHASRKQAIRRQRNLVTGVLFAFMISVMLGIFAFLQRNVAISNEQLANANAQLARGNAATAVANEYARATQQAIAQTNEIAARAQRSAAEAKLFQGQAGKLDLSTLLAIDSWQKLQSPQAEDILRQNVSLMPIPIAHVSQRARIESLQVSPDDKNFLTASDDSTACVWELDNGKQLYCVQQDKAIEDAVYTKDGKFIITGGDDGSVRIWSAADGSLVKRFDFGATIWVLDVSPDGGWLAVGRNDNFATIINLRDFAQKPLNLREPGPVFAISFSPDGKWVGIGGGGGQVMLWRFNQGFFYFGPQHTNDVYALAFSPDSQWVVSGGADSTARVAKVTSGGQRYSVQQGDWVEDVTFSPDSTWFATASDDNNVYAWNTATGQQKLVLQQNGFAQHVKISPDGQWIASTGFDQTVRVWDAASGAEMMQATIGGNGSALSFSNDGKHLLAGDNAGNIFVWDISVLSARLNDVIFPELVHNATFDPSGSWVAVNTDAKTAQIFTVDQMLHTHSGTDGKTVLNAKDLTYSLAISPDSQWIGVNTKNLNEAILENIQANKVFDLPQNTTVNDVAISSDNKMVATAGASGIISIWDLQSGNKLFDLKDSSPVTAVAFGPQPNRLASAANNQVVVWDVAQQKQITTWNNTGQINRLKFSHDGAWLAGGNSDGSIYLWTTQGPNVSVPTFDLQQNGQVLSLDFSPDDHWLASGSSENFAYVWNVNNGQEMTRLPHIDAVDSVSFSRDGSMLATASKKVVEIWNFSAIPKILTKDLEAAACERLTANLSQNEWQTYFFNEPYQIICPGLPSSN
ncbi:MAG TPA: TIR domain-containing protein [Anaerolineales bacterium]|nr:TIR domain-containing protein [Anaerolineales bacterium]